MHNTMRDGGNIFECPRPEWRIVQGKRETKSAMDSAGALVSFRRGRAEWGVAVWLVSGLSSP